MVIMDNMSVSAAHELGWVSIFIIIFVAVAFNDDDDDVVTLILNIF